MTKVPIYFHLFDDISKSILFNSILSFATLRVFNVRYVIIWHWLGARAPISLQPAKSLPPLPPVNPPPPPPKYSKPFLRLCCQKFCFAYWHAKVMTQVKEIGTYSDSHYSCLHVLLQLSKQKRAPQPPSDTCQTLCSWTDNKKNKKK